MSVAKIKIKSIRSVNSFQIKKFLEEVNVAVNNTFESNDSVKVRDDIFGMLHSLLPLHWKILQDTYVAIEGSRIIGMVGLVPDSRSNLRWKINQLLLKPHSYDVGKILLDYVASKYGAEGVEIFLVEVNSTDNDALDLFKNACCYRKCTVNNLYKKVLSGKIPQETLMPGFRRVESADDTKLVDLYLECLTPQTKMSLAKNKTDFSFDLFESLKNHSNNVKSFNWVLEDHESKAIVAYANLITRNNSNYYIDVITSLPYADYYRDILNCMIRFVGLKNNNATIFIYTSESIQSHSKFVEIIKEFEFEHYQMSYVLVKDYWQPINERKSIASPIIIFSDGASPACNSLNMARK